MYSWRYSCISTAAPLCVPMEVIGRPPLRSALTWCIQLLGCEHQWDSGISRSTEPQYMKQSLCDNSLSFCWTLKSKPFFGKRNSTLWRSIFLRRTNTLTYLLTYLLKHRTSSGVVVTFRRQLFVLTRIHRRCGKVTGEGGLNPRFCPRPLVRNSW